MSQEINASRRTRSEIVILLHQVERELLTLTGTKAQSVRARTLRADRANLLRALAEKDAQLVAKFWNAPLE